MSRKIFNRTAATVLTLALTFAISTFAAPALAGGCGSGHAEKAAENKAATIYETAKAAGFTTLSAAIDAAGLGEALSAEGPYTVFAPTDEAFAKLPEGTVEALLADTEKLKQVLLYHVAAGEVTSDQVVKLARAETLSGAEIAIDSSEGVKINEASVIKADVAASNGVIHVIDSVLIPAGI